MNLKNQINNDYEKEVILKDLKRWHYGIWMKDIEIIKSTLNNGIWNSTFRNRKGNYIHKNSYQPGFRRIDKSIAIKLDNLLNKKLRRYGKYFSERTNESAFKKILTESGYKKLMNGVKI